MIQINTDSARRMNLRCFSVEATKKKVQNVIILCSQMIDFSGITGQSNTNTFSPPGRIIPVQLLASFVSFFGINVSGIFV